MQDYPSMMEQQQTRLIPADVQIKCLQHLTYPKEFIYIYDQDDEPLLCFYCAKHKFKSMQSILHYREIQEASAETIWPYFPPLQNENLWIELSQLEGQIKEIEELHSHIEGFYCKLQEDITCAIESSKARMNKSIQMLKELRQKTIDSYNEIASKQELMKLFKDENEGITKRLTEIIKEKQANVVPNTRIITSAMQNFRTMFEKISFRKPTQLKEELIKMAKSMEFFSGLDLDVYAEFIDRERMRLGMKKDQTIQENSRISDHGKNQKSLRNMNEQNEKGDNNDDDQEGSSSENDKLKENQENISQLDEIIHKYLYRQEDEIKRNDNNTDKKEEEQQEEERKLNDNQVTISRQPDSIDYRFNNIPQQFRGHSSNKSSPKDQSKQISNTNLLVKLIASKTNFCSEQFIQVLQECLQKVSFFIDKYDLKLENALDERKRQEFQSLDSAQIEQLRLLAKQILQTQSSYQAMEFAKKTELDQFLNVFEQEEDEEDEDDEEEYDSTVDANSRTLNQNKIDSREATEVMTYDKSNKSEESIEIDDDIEEQSQLQPKGNKSQATAAGTSPGAAPSLSEINQEIQSKSSFVFSQLKDSTSSQEQQQELSHLLKQFPVFELLHFPLKKQLLNSCWFSKSSFKGSHNQAIKRTDQGFIQILAEGSPDYKLSYSSFKLDFNKKYVLRIILRSGPSSTDTFMVFGLTDDAIKDQSALFSQGISYCERRNEFGLNRVIKGGDLHRGSKRNLYREFEVRIHLRDRIIKVSDYPDYRNVCELDDKNKIKMQSEYRFATELSYANDSFTFNSIQEVDCFDDNM